MKTLLSFRFLTACLTLIFVWLEPVLSGTGCLSVSADITARAFVADPIGMIVQPDQPAERGSASLTDYATSGHRSKSVWLRLPRHGAAFVTVDRDGECVSRISTDESMTVEIAPELPGNQSAADTITVIFSEN